MNERYRGSKRDITLIRRYLRTVRSEYPSELRTTPTCFRLSEGEGSKLVQVIDCGLFWVLAKKCVKYLRSYSAFFRFMEAERCYFIPVNRTELGGFYCAKSIGYRYFPHISISELMNPALVPNKLLRTCDALRCYLHDSIHADTYRSFRVVPPYYRGGFPIYREQYGVNFRRYDGLSYSDRALTKLSPETINLNTLMDGLNAILVARAIAHATKNIDLAGLTPLENAILQELIGATFDEHIYPQPLEYWREVQEPVRIFLAKWGGEEFEMLIFQAMMTGRLAHVKRYFAHKRKLKDAWVKIFKRSDF